MTGCEVALIFLLSPWHCPEACCSPSWHFTLSCVLSLAGWIPAVSRTKRSVWPLVRNSADAPDQATGTVVLDCVTAWHSLLCISPNRGKHTRGKARVPHTGALGPVSGSSTENRLKAWRRSFAKSSEGQMFALKVFTFKTSSVRHFIFQDTVQLRSGSSYSVALSATCPWPPVSLAWDGDIFRAPLAARHRAGRSETI